MFRIIKWIIIIIILYYLGKQIYRKIDSFIDVKKTTKNVVIDIKDGVRKKDSMGPNDPNFIIPN